MSFFICRMAGITSIRFLTVLTCSILPMSAGI